MKRVAKKTKVTHAYILTLPPDILLHHFLAFLDSADLLVVNSLNQFFHGVFGPSSVRDSTTFIDQAWIARTIDVIDDYKQRQPNLTEFLSHTRIATNCRRILDVLLHLGCEHCGKALTRKVQIPFFLRACDACMKDLCVPGFELETTYGFKVEASLWFQRVETWSYHNGNGSYKRYLREQVEVVTGVSLLDMRQKLIDTRQRALREYQRPILDNLRIHPLVSHIDVDEEVFFSLGCLPLDERVPLENRVLQLRVTKCAKEYLLKSFSTRCGEIKAAFIQDGQQLDEKILHSCPLFWTTLSCVAPFTPACIDKIGRQYQGLVSKKAKAADKKIKDEERKQDEENEIFQKINAMSIDDVRAERIKETSDHLSRTELLRWKKMSCLEQTRTLETCVEEERKCSHCPLKPKTFLPKGFVQHCIAVHLSKWLDNKDR